MSLLLACSHSCSSPGSRLLCPPWGCPPSPFPAAAVSRALGLSQPHQPASQVPAPTPVPDPQVRSLPGSRPPPVLRALRTQPVPGSLPRRLTVPPPDAILDISARHRCTQPSLGLPVSPAPAHPPPPAPCTVTSLGPPGGAEARSVPDLMAPRGTGQQSHRGRLAGPGH